MPENMGWFGANGDVSPNGARRITLAMTAIQAKVVAAMAGGHMPGLPTPYDDQASWKGCLCDAKDTDSTKDISPKQSEPVKQCCWQGFGQLTRVLIEHRLVIAGEEGARQ